MSFAVNNSAFEFQLTITSDGTRHQLPAEIAALTKLLIGTAKGNQLSQPPPPHGV